MRGFRLMIAFFTRLPAGVPVYTEGLFARGIRTMPFVGLILGVILYLAGLLRLLGLPEPVLGLVLLGVYCFTTGGLHFDGVADTCDGIFSAQSRERMLEIMKDSHIGTFGVLGLVLLLLGYVVFLGEVGKHLPPALLCMPVVGKGAMVMVSWKAPCARKEGMGYGFITRVGKTELFWALAVVPLVILLMEPGLLPAGGIALGGAFAARKKFERTLGGLTGDTLGFICEWSQILFAASAFFTWYVAEGVLSGGF